MIHYILVVDSIWRRKSQWTRGTKQQLPVPAPPYEAAAAAAEAPTSHATK